MKKLLFIAMLAAFTATSCVKDDVYVTEGEPVPPADYTGLVLNEINGTGEDTEKYIELYNNSAAEISLQGVQITYGGVSSWTGKASDKIAAGAYLVLQGSKGTGALSSGLSAGKQIRVELLDPSGNVLDYFQRGNGDGNTAAIGAIDMDYSRMPNGLGAWYLTAATGTKGVTNGISTSGLTKVESDLPNEPIQPTGALVLNEINGTPAADAEKYIELYNGTSASIDLNGYTITYGGDLTWTGTNGKTIAAGGYLVLQGSKNTGDLIKGLSAGKQIKIELKNATGDVIDTFQRGDGLGGDVTVGPTDKDYSRLPNGTGDWYYTDAAGTKGVTNGTSASGMTAVD